MPKTITGLFMNITGMPMKFTRMLIRFTEMLINTSGMLINIAGVLMNISGMLMNVSTLSRLSTYAHSGETGYLDPLSRHTDLLALNKYLGWYGGHHDDFGPWIDIIHAKYPDVKLAVSEYGAGANIFQHVDIPNKRPKHDGDFHPEEWQVSAWLGSSGVAG
jgi:hypothetical protein